MRRGAKPATAKGEGKRPVARKSGKGEGSRVGDLEKRLAEALEQQTATAEILRVISSSPTDVQPVFSAILANALRLCGADQGGVFTFDGHAFRLAAISGKVTPEFREALASEPIPPGCETPLRRVALERRLMQVADIQNDPGYSPPTIYRAEGMRTSMAVPLLKDGELIGALAFHRREVRPFTEQQMSMVETFADQAVIAIENVRLFTELEARNRDLSETLEQQTATAEILRVISTSPTNLQPVLDTLAASAARFCGSYDGSIFHLAGDTLRLAAHHGPLSNLPVGLEVPVVRGAVMGRSILDREAVHVTDLQAETEEFPEGSVIARDIGFHTLLSVPLLREGAAIGAIGLRRIDVSPFTDKQIALAKTFADQAVIAIENVRLFAELQASNRELTTALDTQTATSDILRVISRSQTDVQPVFVAILASAVRLLRAYVGALTRVTGDQIELAAMTSTDDAVVAAARALYPQPLQSAGVHAQALRARAPLNIADAYTDPRLPESAHAYAQFRGYRSQVVVPMLRDDEAVGTIGVTRREPGGFTDDEIALLKTFADQAVIAIENARLLSELQARTQELTRSVDQLTALGEVGRAVSSTLDLGTVLTTIVSRAVELSGLDGGLVSEYDEIAEEFVQRATAEIGEVLPQALREVRYRKGEGAIGRTAITREPVQIADITVPGAYESRVRQSLIQSGVRAVLAVPMIHQNRLIGCLGVTRKRPGEFPTETIELLRTFATQSALAIQNARLYQEIADKSRQLEAASQHKSEFLANMSHELRTPLNAIIGFSEVLGERMFGELNAKQEEYLKDIHASGQHLLSLINDILDLSKIEAGRMELELTDFDLPTAIDNALTLVRERAARRGITLGCEIDERVGMIQGDERKVKQVLLNMLSNALKFTPEGGRIDVRTALKEGTVEISVTDTGVGIAPEDQEAIFEEFRQVGTSDKKVEGTGLGLALSRKFVELHGGRIWVKSQLGQGSTFTFTIPVRSEP
jgi:signal transduction histidine kinase